MALIAEDDLFDVVESFVDEVRDAEIAVDDHVEQGPERAAEVVVGAFEPDPLETPLDLLHGHRLAAIDRLADGEEPVLAEHHVNLLDDDLIARGRGPLPVVAVPLQLGALIRRTKVVERERVDRELLGQVVQLLVGEVDGVDDEEGALPAPSPVEIIRIDGLALRDAMPEPLGLDHDVEAYGRGTRSWWPSRR